MFLQLVEPMHTTKGAFIQSWFGVELIPAPAGPSMKALLIVHTCESKRLLLFIGNAFVFLQGHSWFNVNFHPSTPVPPLYRIDMFLLFDRYDFPLVLFDTIWGVPSQSLPFYRYLCDRGIDVEGDGVVPSVPFPT